MLADRDALYQEILANPDDDAPRLVYADWLEEHGELIPQGRQAASAYARFIRTQIELAKTPDYDPLWVRLWHEDRDMITGRGFDAFRPDLPPGVKWDDYQAFRRGFPERIQVESLPSFLDNAPAVFAVTPVQGLMLHADYSAAPPELTPLANSPHLARLRRLNFCLSRLPAVEIERLQASPYASNLTELEFEFAGIARDGFHALFRPPLIEQLTRVRLHDNDLVGAQPVETIQSAGGPHRLRSLVVTPATSQHLGLGPLGDAPLFPGLVELSLSGYTLETNGFRILAESPTLVGLKSLSLARSYPKVEGIRALAGSPNASCLLRLSLGANRLGPVAAQLLAQSPHLANLQVLDVTNNPVGDRGAKALAASPHLSRLVQLELMHCEIGDAGAEALLESPIADGLIHLNLYGDSRKTRISDEMKRRLRDRFGTRVFV